MAPSKGPPVALFIHRRQRDVESCPHRPGCHVSHHLPNPPWQSLYDSFNWVTQQVDQTNAQAGFLQKIHGRPEIVVVFLFHSILSYVEGIRRRDTCSSGQQSEPQRIKPFVSCHRTYQLAGLSPISDAIYISKKL